LCLLFTNRRLIKTIREIEKHNKNIVLIVNKAKQEELEAAKKIFDDFFDYPLLRLKKSTAFVKMVKSKKSLQALTENNVLLRYSYKEPLEQVEAIKDFIS